MRFLTRSLIGIFLLCLTAGLIAFALNTFYQAAAERADRESRTRPPQERVFAVNVATLRVGPATPQITAFGEVASRRTLDIRATSGGRVISLSEGFRDGGVVAAGDVLVQIDPADAEAAVEIARAELAEAEASAREAETRASLAGVDLQAAVQTRDLRAQALARQKGLQARGAGTGAAVEAAEIALATAEQSVVGRRQALAQATASQDLAAIAVERRRIALNEAERALADTTVTAPYDGLLTASAVVPGGLVSPNEKIGSLIDTEALEVAFRISNADFARLIAATGALQNTSVLATLPLDDFPLRITGRLDRAGAQVGTGQTGRLLYATLDGPGAEALRPGDFMVVTIEEPVLEGVTVVPATAVTQSGELYLLTEDDRLEAIPVTILRRQGDDVILRDVPVGREYAEVTPAQLGPGVKVRPIRAGAEMAAPDMVELTPELRAELIAALEANSRMPQPVKTRIRERLEGARVGRELVDRLQNGGRPGGGQPAMGQSADAAPETGIALAPERRAKLIAFVEGNQGMPQEVKARILAQLNAAEVPSDVVERLERRMGG